MAGSDENEVVEKVKVKKDKSEKSHKDKSEKKEKKDKKRSETDGVSKDKKDKKKDKAKKDKLARVLDEHLQADAAAEQEKEKAATKPKKSKKTEESDSESDAEEPTAKGTDIEDKLMPTAEMVWFARPIADDKTQKKALKTVKRAARLKAICRGIKECEKAISRTPIVSSNAPETASPPGLVIIAGDIYPEEVIMHFPIHCEEHGIPYLFVRSRAELGVASCTKRATSVVMLRPEPLRKAKKGDKMEIDGDDKKEDKLEEYKSGWADLVKKARAEWVKQVEPWVKGSHPEQNDARARGENIRDYTDYLG